MSNLASLSCSFFVRSRLPRVVALALALAVAAWSAPAHARAARRAAPRSRTTLAVAPGGKIAVFPFQYDDDHTLGAQVERLLRARGFQVLTDVRPVDTAEQYRELASTLNLAALIGGSYLENDKNARLTLQIRSGYSGRRLVAATFKENRFHLHAQVEDKLWAKIGPAVARACADASRPRRHGRDPLVIDAGTSLASSGQSYVP
jgi:hypothetical protein